MLLSQLFEQQTQAIHLPIFRGTYGGGKLGAVVKFPVRQNRQPSDSSMIFSAIFNYGLEQRLGIPEIRKRSCYASTSLDTATEYAMQRMEQGDDDVMCVQMIVPSNAVLVFNSRIKDSLMIQNERGVTKTFVRGLEWFWRKKNNVDDKVPFYVSSLCDADVYLKQNSKTFIQTIIDAVSPDERGMKELWDEAERAAKTCAVGYYSMTPQEFADTYDAGEEEFEVMIVNVTEVQGEIVNRFNRAQDDSGW